MHLFDEIDPNLFSPLTGKNKNKYVDLLTLIWDKCRRDSMYATEKSTVLDMAEEYFLGLDEKIELDPEEQEGGDGDMRVISGSFIRRLKNTGWLVEHAGEYEDENRLAVNYKVVPILKAFQDITSPSIITYKGKLFKIYSMFLHISEQVSPYEGILKEASDDFDNLNQALRTLAASIEDHMNRLTEGKRPEEVLEFFEKYEEKIVVGAYHRFKTNDNLFYYRTSLYQGLDRCEDEYFAALVQDCMETEQYSRMEAEGEIHRLLDKLRMDIEEMEGIMRTIDDRHILYRSRAVQRAQFLLLSDGTAKSKINHLLQFYANQITSKEQMYEEDDSCVAQSFQIFVQNYFDSSSLATPVKKRKATPIEVMEQLEELDLELVNASKQKIMAYIANALTMENVNTFAKKMLENRPEITARAILEKEPESFIRIIGLYTYSQSGERSFDLVMRDEYVQQAGVRFKNFSIRGRKSYGSR